MSNERVLGHVGMGTGTHRPFNQLYENSLLISPDDIDQGAPIDALVIWGGGDISPTLYNDSVAMACGATEIPSYRDKLEWDACKAALRRDIPIIGVCRGAQLACALAGGRLIQHVTGHAGGLHEITTFDGELVKSSSVHHQMMYPFDVADHKLIAWTTTPKSRGVYIIGNDKTDPLMEDKPEPEIVWFPAIKALAIQGHPEFHSNPDSDPFVQYCMKMVQQFILDENEESHHYE